jgi:hypothetical protein
VQRLAADYPAMTLETRLDVRLPAATRRALDALAADTGLTSADLVRIGIRWLLTRRRTLLRAPKDLAAEAGRK